MTRKTRQACVRRAWAVAGLSIVLASSARPSWAQSRPGFAVNRFEPAERGGEWFVVDALDMRGRGRPHAGVTLDYAHKPLVVYDGARNERFALVRHQLFAHAGGALVFADRLRVAASLPFAVHQDGEAGVVNGERLAAATAPAAGDLRVAVELGIFGRHRGPISIALGVRGWFPTGVRSQFTSDGSVRLAPQVLIAGEAAAFVWAARTAVVHRPLGDTYAGTPLGSELTFALGAGVRVGRFALGPEIFASTALSGVGLLRERRTPVDALLGVRYEDPSGLRLAVAVGSGLTRGFGSPAMRALASIEWGAPVARAPDGDRDGDSVLDAVDACPDAAGPPSGDPEANGCPLPERVPDEDTDGDKIWDRDDACPGLAGIVTGDPMTNGCPPDAPRPLAVVTRDEIKIGEAIQFAIDSADLAGESEAVLGAVLSILEKHPDILRVRVEGHTDDTGDPARNEDLSRRRAAAVARWLSEHGVSPARLSSDGFGSQRPLQTNLTEEGRAKNRRVTFVIVERAPSKAR